MRVTESYRYFNYLANQQTVTGNLNNTLTQLSSGLKIQFGNEDPTAFINTLRLDQEVNTLEQSTANMTSSQKFANHTDTTLNDITKSLEQFKTKLVYAANDEHDHTSYGALAKELQAIRDHLVNLANTNINGEYLFSGSATSVKPVSADGTYNGNASTMKALVGSNIESAYNIPGSELFLGQDVDYSKKLTTNVVLYNQTKLHPSVMEEGIDSDDSSKEEFITPNDTIRDLVGDSDDDATNNGDYFFYVSGVQSSGKAFKEKIQIDTNSSVDALLTKIGEAYGNTSGNKVVDVTVNKGRIEITDLQKGSSKLDFHMFASDTDNNDIDALVSSGAQIMEFIKTPYKNTPTMGDVNAMQSLYDDAVFTINSALKTDNATAKSATPLTDVFVDEVDNIRIYGNDTDGNAVDFSIAKAGSSVKDILSQIEANFGNVDARLTSEGKIEVIDESGNGLFDFAMQTRDAANVQVNGFGNDVGAMQTNAFEVKDTYVKSNVAQIVTATNEFATDTTKLSEVASEGDIEGSVFDIRFTDINGIERTAQVDFDPAGVSVNVFNSDGTPYDNFDVISHDGTNTAPNDMTYRQLQDVMGMLVTDNIPDMGAADYTQEYRDNVKSANARTDVFVDQNGMMTIKDKNVTQTNIRFSMHDANANDFGADASKMTFSANNSLVIDDVHVDMFSMLDNAIEAVANGFTRPDGSNDTMMRNVGIQNLIEKLDHVSDHTIRKHTEIGALSQSFNYQISRNETLMLHTKTLRSEIIDVDYAEAAMNLQRLQLNYQAMATSFAKIQNLSLLNYL
jgi:flagellar hook-associated protein 3 FlgL